MPELLVTLLYVEALEDNETLTIENIRQLSRIIDPKNKAIFEILDEPKTVRSIHFSLLFLWIIFPFFFFADNDLLS